MGYLGHGRGHCRGPMHGLGHVPVASLAQWHAHSGLHGLAVDAGWTDAGPSGLVAGPTAGQFLERRANRWLSLPVSGRCTPGLYPVVPRDCRFTLCGRVFAGSA
uniref:Uncharacterized protein n=1 Tax=Panagrolaimus superbus TaxID=310955 RepID=A0A914XYC4_9BILA